MRANWTVERKIGQSYEGEGGDGNFCVGKSMTQRTITFAEGGAGGEYVVDYEYMPQCGHFGSRIDGKGSVHIRSFLRDSELRLGFRAAVSEQNIRPERYQQAPGNDGAYNFRLIVAALPPPEPMQRHGNDRVNVLQPSAVCNLLCQHSRKIFPLRDIPLIFQLIRNMSVAIVVLKMEERKSRSIVYISEFINMLLNFSIEAVGHRVVPYLPEMCQRKVRATINAHKSLIYKQFSSTHYAGTGQQYIRRSFDCPSYIYFLFNIHFSLT